MTGLPCRTCVLWGQSPRLPEIGYCDVYKTWQKADERPFDCNDHTVSNSLEAKLSELFRALAWLTHAINYYSGVNAGEPDDPRHWLGPDVLKPRRAAAEARERARRIGERIERLIDGL